MMWILVLLHIYMMYQFLKTCLEKHALKFLLAEVHNKNFAFWVYVFQTRIRMFLRKALQTVTAAMKLKDACSSEKKLWKT